MTLSTSEVAMNTAAHASILYRLDRSHRAPAAPDPADLGTAFGLDLSMEPPAPEAGDEAAAPTWLERLGLKPAP
jgi:hypothetical protein